MDQKFQAGAKLKNGATLLAWKEERDNVIVLAFDARTAEFVTWVTAADGDCVSGNYFHGLLDAVEDFKSRY